MASLRDELEIIMEWLNAKHPQASFGEQCARELELVIRQRLGGDRIYVTPPDSRKDPSRAEAIRSAASRLPTGVVSQRLGVSRQLIAYHVKKGKKPAG
jgi:hypothetical protein